MKNNVLFLLGTLFIFLWVPISAEAQIGNMIENLTGGPSPKQLFKQGKFPESLVAYLEDISNKPGKKGPLKSLGKAYPELMDSIQAQGVQLKEATSTFRGDATVGNTKMLISYYHTFQKAHDIFVTLGITNIDENRVQVTLDIPNVEAQMEASEILLGEHIENAAEMHYQQGLTHASYDEIERQKAAAREFYRAMDFIPGYKDSQEKYETARSLGTKRIVILPYGNLTNIYDFGAIGDQLSTSLVVKLSENSRVMEFLHVTSESELRAVLENEGQTYEENISETTAEDLLQMTELHAVYFGKINQILNPNPTTSNSNVKTHTASVKVGEKIVWNEKKNREETVDVFEDRNATYRDCAKTYSTSVSGTHSIVTAEGPQLTPYTKRLTWSQTWTQKVAGHDKVYEKIQKAASPIPIPGERVNYVISQIAQEMYLEIEKEIIGSKYPVITEVEQVETP